MDLDCIFVEMIYFCGNDLFQASKTITKDKALDMHLHDSEAVCIF